MSKATHLRMVTLLSIMNLGGLCTFFSAPVFAEDLRFSIVGAGPHDVRPLPAVEGLDFRVMGPPAINADWQNAARGLNFSVVGKTGAAVTARPAEKPLIYVYSAPTGIPCVYCDLLARQSAQLPYTLQWKPAPEWVDAYPTLHWKGADGSWLKCEGWPGVAEFIRLYRQSQSRAVAR